MTPTPHVPARDSAPRDSAPRDSASHPPHGTRPRGTRRRTILTIAVTTAAAIGVHAAALAFFAGRDPYSETIFPPCPLLAATGWQCPACGGTRALYSLLHLDIEQSWRLNPLVIVLYVVAAVVIAGLIAHARGRARVANAIFMTLPVIVVPVLVYSAVIRNLLP